MAGGTAAAERGTGAGPPPWGFAPRLATFYAALFLMVGIKATYLPVWLDWTGLSAGEIGIIVSTPLFLRIVATPALAFLADRYGDHRRSIIALAWAGVAVLLALTGVAGFWPILLLTVALSLSSTTIMPLTETVAMDGVRRAGLDYGRMRLWGSLSFIAAAFGSGVAVKVWGPGAVIWLLLAGGALIALAAHALPGTSEPKEARRPPAIADMVDLLVRPDFALLLLAAGAVQAGHAMFYTFGVLHWQSQGIGPVTASSLWAIGVVVEIALFAFSGAAVQRFGALALIVAGGAAGVVRWSAMALDPPPGVLVGLQALHGITYGATHLGAVHLIASIVPRAQAGSAQALYASVTSGILLGGATLAIGRYYPALGGASYAAMALLSFVGLAAALALGRRLRGREAEAARS